MVGKPQRSRTSQQPLSWRAANNSNNARNRRNQGPVIGEARVHRKTGLTYIFERIPGTERLGWLRYDTWWWGALRKFPWRIAKAKHLVKFPRRALELKDADFTIVHSAFE